MGNPTEPPVSTDLDDSVHDVVLGMLDRDEGIGEAARDWVIEALATVESDADDDAATAAPTYLSTISVVGFRGIGPQARLDLHPAPGLTVVSGRNGSGKSSFAEALELTLTGTSYRWHNRSAMWEDAWRNLHQPRHSAIRIGFTAEGNGAFTVGMNWDDDAALADRAIWTQHGSDERRPGTAELGWSRALELFRPLLSYEELGRLFDGGPSALYDALSKLLGLEVLTDADKWLGAQIKETRTVRDRADGDRRTLVRALTGQTDDRAARAAKLLRKHGGAPLDEVRALATGSDDEGQRTAAALRALADLPTPALDDVGSTAARLRSARLSHDHAAQGLARGAAQRNEVLTAGLRLHDHVGDTTCPLCGQGELDGRWAARARESISDTESSLLEFRRAEGELRKARGDAGSLVNTLPDVSAPDGIALPAVAAYDAAVRSVRDQPADDGALADHLESTMLAVAEAAEAVRAEASAALSEREDHWAPLATRLGAWVDLERSARELDGTLEAMRDAKAWITASTVPFRDRRLESIAAQARKIWASLRQQSNVGLGEITLQGSATRRRAVLGGSVDGEPTAALTVMSQGELHALALALFVPRATSAKSPFRFVVLDDPIQAMDPAKIDGFVQVLEEVAATRQVVVFSHDDRLASVIRDSGVDARIVEVTRESGSRVAVRDGANPVKQAVSDVIAVVKDEQMPDAVRARVIPGLFRIAVETAAQQSFYAQRSLAGETRASSEQAWEKAMRTRLRVALAVHGDASADLTGWLGARPDRKRTLFLCNATHGEATGVSEGDIRPLRELVDALLALR